MGRVIYEDIYKGKFSFGRNWKEFLKTLDEKKIKESEKCLIDFLPYKSLKNKTFIDIGCGSGLSSLAAYRLGARHVLSIDVDEFSLECATYLREKYGDKRRWEITKLSALDTEGMARLGTFDIVYSWGVLHHTGDMRLALDNSKMLTKKKGLLFIAIYNDFRGFPSSALWVKIKRLYAHSGKLIRKLMLWTYLTYFVVGLLFYGRNPVKYIKEYKSFRGMSFYRDAVDWLGGYPYEYASVKKIKHFYESDGFETINVKSTRREGCNEFLFQKK